MKHARLMMVAALALVVGLMASTALAASNTSVTIKSHTLDDYLDGKVKSSKSSCKGGRRVILFGHPPGESDFERLANATSENDGYWRIDAPDPFVPPGKYYAKVRRDGSCDSARSETIRVREP